MKTLAITRTVLFGEPPQRYAVSFSVGTRFVRIVGPGRDGEQVTRVMEWRGKAFRPGCQAMTEQAVAWFLNLEASGLMDDRSEQGNEELMIAGRLPTAKTRRVLDHHERQLPAGDRVEVG